MFDRFVLHYYQGYMSANNIHIKVTNDSLKPHQASGCYKIKLRIKGTKLKKRTIDIGVQIKKEHWSEIDGNIKTKYRDLYQQYSKDIDAIYSRIKEVRTPLSRFEMSHTTAFDILMGVNEVKGTILEFAEKYEPDAKTGRSTINKHITNIKALHSAFDNYKGYKKYNPIEFNHLQDERCIDDIANVIINKKSLATNTQASYMKTLNWVCTKAKLNIKNPFTHFDYMVTEKPSGKNQPIDNQHFNVGFNNINTMHQFEALLFWLYSFCLMGLDGRDIASLSEDSIVTDGYKKGYLKDYIPDADVLGNKTFSKPLHAHIKRGKTKRGASDSGANAIFQVNLFPTLIILELLKHAISYNDGDYAYKGNDKLRLYNFDVNTDEGFEEWEKVRNTYTSILHKKIGTTIQASRHTVVNVAGQMGLNQEQVDELLNHKIKGVNKFYWTKQQTATDVSHMHILQEYKVLQTVKDLLEMFKDRVAVIDNEEIPYIPITVMNNVVEKRVLPKINRLQILQLGILSKFSREDEIKYHYMIKDVQKGQTKLIDGKMEIIPVEEKDYPKELKELIAKRNKAYSVKPEIKQKLLDQIDIQYGSPEVEKTKKIIQLNVS